MPKGYRIPSGAVGPFYTWDKLGFEFVGGGPLAGVEPEKVFDAQFEDPSAYASAVVEGARAELDRMGSTPSLRWTEVRAIEHSPESPGTRIVVFFHQDADVKEFAYWGFVWEMVTWVEMHARSPSSIRYQPANLGAMFVQNMFDEAPHRLSEAVRSPKSDVGWIRVDIAW